MPTVEGGAGRLRRRSHHARRAAETSRGSESECIGLRPDNEARARRGNVARRRELTPAAPAARRRLAEPSHVHFVTCLHVYILLATHHVSFFL